MRCPCLAMMARHGGDKNGPVIEPDDVNGYVSAILAEWEKDKAAL